MSYIDPRHREEKIIEDIKNYWKDNISNFQIIDEDFSYGAFTLEFTLYNKFNVLLEYERGTAGFKIKNANSSEDYTILSKYTKEKVYRGFESLENDNFLENIKTLDLALKNNMLKEKKKMKELER
ncbi:hypothetical protein HCA55_14760 [Listeria booriae]|uniref:Uncharacterized protein n=1 Tax=Listeria booriae TaxID=1552123 RepID=A0A842B289_9LIST|nr:hypothetical protein [Listeria booriae]MBC1560138.1 hypothetical protein [Listeria booriae]MBC1797994.1 hypothetical protein [Listeria booriae]MBC2196136.1 hypothetical protein [Listeria booriae]MDT0109686.1 hypothetical protein [Listeria booriae]